MDLELRLLQAAGWPAKAVQAATVKQGNQKVWADVRRRRLMWLVVMKQNYPMLTLLAERLLSQHATVCSVERSWSQVCTG